MGGYGSGRRPKKQLVEQCFDLDISVLYRQIIADRVGQPVAGTLCWDGGFSISYELHWLDGKPELMLSYTYTSNHNEREHKSSCIPIQTAACPYGGARYWLECPNCARRMKKLHFKKGTFACRHCHQLVYKSAQEAHKDGRLSRSLGINIVLFDHSFKIDSLMKRWYDKDHLTHGERCKLADALGLSVGEVRNKWFQPSTTA